MNRSLGLSFCSGLSKPCALSRSSSHLFETLSSSPASLQQVYALFSLIHNHEGPPWLSFVLARYEPKALHTHV